MLPVILIIIIALILVVFFHLQKAMNQIPEYKDNVFIPPSIEEEETDENSLPKPTGNIDDTVDTIINSLSDEESLIKDEKDAGLIDVESQELSDFGQSYDETEF